MDRRERDFAVSSWSQLFCVLSAEVPCFMKLCLAPMGCPPRSPSPRAKAPGSGVELLHVPLSWRPAVALVTRAAVAAMTLPTLEQATSLLVAMTGRLLAADVSLGREPHVISGSALWAPFPGASFGSRSSTSPREENPVGLLNDEGLSLCPHFLETAPSSRPPKTGYHRPRTQFGSCVSSFLLRVS